MTVRRPRLLTAALAAAVVLGLTAGPALSADAAGTRVGTVSVQLQTIKGADWHAKNFVVIAIDSKGEEVKRARTNAQGLAPLHVTPGVYRFTVATYETRYEYAVVTSEKIGIQRGQSKIIGIKMRKGAQITGKVTTPTGFALKSAGVAAVSAKGVVMASTTTDKKGKYRLAGLPTGTYRIIFNWRDYTDGSVAAVNMYGWKYYGGSGLSKAKKVKVYAQNKYAAATKTTGISGSAVYAGDLSVTLSQKVVSSSRLKVERISAKGNYVQSDSVYASFAGGTSRTLKIMGGAYRLGIQVGSDESNVYYYTGDGQTLTRKASAAATVGLGGNISVVFGSIP